VKAKGSKENKQELRFNIPIFGCQALEASGMCYFFLLKVLKPKLDPKYAISFMVSEP
jgi:hypothetical protein